MTEEELFDIEPDFSKLEQLERENGTKAKQRVWIVAIVIIGIITAVVTTLHNISMIQLKRSSCEIKCEIRELKPEMSQIQQSVKSIQKEIGVKNEQ